MPYVRRKKKIHQDGGDQFHVYDAAILRELNNINDHWKIAVRQPDGAYYDPNLILVTKEFGKVGHDRIQTGGRQIPNLMEVALGLYGLQEEVDSTQIETLSFDIDRHDDDTVIIYITPTDCKLFEEDDSMSISVEAETETSVRSRIRRRGHLIKIPSLDRHRQLIRRKRKGYQVPAEKHTDKHLMIVDRLRQQLESNGLQAKGSYQDIDVYTQYQNKDFFFEIKTGGNINKKARNAIGQLLEYEYLYKDVMPDPKLCIVIDTEPDEALIGFLEYLEISLCWNTASGFNCAPYCCEDLSFLTT